jgi:rhamnosyltransferase
MKQVIVLMSTYNGAEYLEEQIDSIMRQKGVSIRLHVRDDGSTDNTADILKKMEHRYKGRLYWKSGENIGYRRSFLMLLQECESADYYAFADQDDVWDEKKTIRAVTMLTEAGRDGPALYASGLYLVNEKLQNRSKKIIDKSGRSLEGHFLRGMMAGCTLVFNRDLAELAKQIPVWQIPDSSMPSHDFWVAACAYALGTVVIDDEPFLLHRRHEGSWGADKRKIRQRVKVEYRNIFLRRNVASSVAAIILREHAGRIEASKKTFMVAVRDNTKSVRNKWRLIRYPGFRTDNMLMNAETYFKILIGRY